MKDLFIDTNIAKNFANPASDEYKRLIQWLIEYDEDGVEKGSVVKENFAHLVLNDKVIKEYHNSARGCFQNSSMPVLLAILVRQGRVNKFEKTEIASIKKQHFTKSITRSLLSNVEDHQHICSILGSHRKFVLTYDKNLEKDLCKFKKFNIFIRSRPDEIEYKK